MTLAVMQGFETQRDLPDFILQNGSTPIISAYRPGFGPSVSGVAGTSMRPIGTTITQLYSSGVWGSATDRSVGYINTGITANQAWNAGGVTLGFGAKYNGGNNLSLGSGGNNNPASVCFDGTRYWALGEAGGGFSSVYYSTNLQTWTLAPTQLPNNSINGNGTIYCIPATGTLVVCQINNPGTTGFTAYYSNNSGNSWTPFTVPGQTGTTTTLGGFGPTGNSSFPIVCWQQATAATTTNGTVSVANAITGTFTTVATIPTQEATIYSTKIKNIGGYVVVLVASASVNYVYSAQSSNASINTTGAWTTSTSTAFAGLPQDLAYDPVSNLWALATTTGIWTTLNSGAAGTPIPPSGTTTWTQRYSTVGVGNLYYTAANVFVGVGQQGHIVTSPDGITWTETTGRVLPIGTVGTQWQSVLYDGTQYVLFSDATNGLVATTPDLVNNYVIQYVLENAETAITASNTSNLPSGLVPATTVPNASTGQFLLQQVGTVNVMGMVVGPQASNVRTINTQTLTLASGGVTTAAIQLTFANVSAVPGSYHYFELHYVKSGSTANVFTLALYIDGVLQGTGPATAMLPATDTTSLLLIGFQRNGCFTAFDDIYVTLNDGIANTLQGPLGVVNVVAARPTVDVSDHWLKNGSATSNSLSVNQLGYSSQTANFVSSNVAGDKDVYQIPTGVIPAGYVVEAVSTEAVFTRTTSSAPSVNVGISSAGTESDSATVSLTTNNPTFVSQYYQTNPNGGVAWTPTAAGAVEPVLNHTI